MAHSRSRDYSAESNSPRQQFQSRVRQLNSQGIQRHRRNPSISLQHNPYELQHTSSLHVQQKSRSGARASGVNLTSLRQVTAEPDFITEEREAWGRLSPSLTPERGLPKKLEHNNHYLSEQNVTDNESSSHLPAFAPLPKTVDVNRRPMTRRGPESINRPVEFNVSPRKPKFVEGSMTARSAATASSWSDHGSDCDASESEAEDTDVTPKATENRSNSSLDLRDFVPPTASKSTVKRTLFGRRNDTTTEDEGEKPKKSRKHKQEKDGKKTVRKSKSGWNLHAFGEKMGFFNHSSTTIDDVDDKEIPTLPDKSVLDDRKRKAEEAYLEQFGSKKQKDNAGNSCETVQPEQPKTVRRRDASFDPNVTVRARSGRPTRRTSTGSTDGQHNLNQHDIRKQQSIKELEKENEHLRTLLREQEAAKNATIRRTSNVVNYSRTIFVDETDVPPIPSLSPARKPLSNILNVPVDSPVKIVSPEQPILKPTSQHTRPSRASTRHSLPALFRPIIEDPEGEDETESKKNVIETKSKKGALKYPTIRRRISDRVLDLSKQRDAEKENSGLNLQMVQRRDGDGNWKGWDDDVF